MARFKKEYLPTALVLASFVLGTCLLFIWSSSYMAAERAVTLQMLAGTLEHHTLVDDSPELVRSLRDCKGHARAAQVYVFRHVGDQFINVADSETPPIWQQLGTRVYQQPPQALINLAKACAQRPDLADELFTHELYADELGHWCSIFVPIHGTDGQILAYLGLDYQIWDWAVIVLKGRVGFFALAIIALAGFFYMRDRERKLKDLLKAKSLFLSSMSHELRTPLVGILGGLELMPDCPHGNTAHQEAKDDVRNSTMLMLSVVNQLLDYHKIGAGLKVEVAQEPICVDLIIKESVRIMRGRLAANVSLVYDDAWHHEVFHEKYTVLGDRLKLTQVIMNVLGNAIKYTDAGEIKIKVQHELIDDHLSLMVAVSDTGIGIEPEKFDRLFQPFYRATDRASGTGLGLTIVKAYVEAMGGRVSLRSKVGGGTTFTIWLELPVRETRAQAAANTHRPSTLPRLRILLAEDTPVNAKMACALLRGHDVTHVTNGVEAVERVVSKKEVYDVVLMDIQMPHMDGVTACRKIKGHSPGQRVVALTASALNDSREKYLRHGFDGYLAKPYTKLQLLTTISEVMNAGPSETIGKDD